MNCPYCGRDITAHFPLTDAQRRVLNALDPWRAQSTLMVADATGYSRSYTALIMRQLRHLDLVHSTGRQRGYVRPAVILERVVQAA